MSDESESDFTTKGLDQMIKLFGKPAPQTRIGILADKTARESKHGGANNAEIGAAHEFGTSELPQRSFLRVPIAEHLESKLQSSGLLEKDALKESLAAGNLVPFMEKVAIVAEGISIESFDSSGDGKWPPSNMDAKKTKQTLVETGQLRNSITHEVKEGTG